MNSEKLNKIMQDLKEVKYKFDEIGLDIKDTEIFITGHKELKEAIEMLEEDLKDHLETIENFICDIN